MRMFRPFLVVGVLIAVPAAGLRGLGVALVLVAVNELFVLASDLRAGRARLPSRYRRLTTWTRLRAGWLLDRLFGWFRRRRHVSQSATFPSYERVMGDLAWARHSRRDFDLTLRKRLLDAAAVRLQHEHGVDLDRQPERAERLLGADAWSVLAPGRPASIDRSAPGVSTADVERVVRAIEDLGTGSEPNRGWT
jgi:hypothetical protein